MAEGGAPDCYNQAHPPEPLDAFGNLQQVTVWLDHAERDLLCLGP